MNTYVLSLGSNTDAQKNIPLALRELEQLGIVVSQSRFIKTVPINTVNKSAFVNGLVLLDSSSSPTLLKKQLRTLELKLGRTPELKEKEIIPIDVDIIICNGAFLGKDVERDYIQLLLAELRVDKK